MRAAPGRQGYSLLRGGEEGMSPAELRALPVVIHERRHRHAPPAAEARAPSSHLPRAPHTEAREAGTRSSACAHGWHPCIGRALWFFGACA